MIIPSSIQSIDHLTTTMWEIEQMAAELRKGSNVQSSLSISTQELLDVNGVHELDSTVANTLVKQLTAIKSSAKQVHVSTGSMATFEWRNRITKWLRSEIDEHLFCSFSSNISQGGGVVLRTPKNAYSLVYKDKILTNSPTIARLLPS